MFLRAFFKGCLVLVFVLLVFVFNAEAAITVDNTSSNGAFNFTGVSSLTWSHQVGNGENKALYVGVSTSTTNLPFGVPADRVAGVTYNGIPLTRVGTAISSDLLNTTEIFRLVNPQNGNHSIVVTLAGIPAGGNPFVNYVVGGAISLHGVNQTTPNGTFFSAAGTSNMPVVVVTDSVNGDLVLDTLAVPPPALFAVAGMGQTERWDGQTFFGNSFDVGAGSTKTGLFPSVQMSWQTTNSSNWAIGAVAIKQFVLTASTVQISGRVTNANGFGVPGAVVSLTNSQGETVMTKTNPFGFFHFQEISIGESYVAAVTHKHYQFAPQVITVMDNISDLVFVAQTRKSRIPVRVSTPTKQNN